MLVARAVTFKWMPADAQPRSSIREERESCLTAPFRASSPHGTCDSAMKAALFDSTSAANDAANFDLSR